MPGSLRTTLYSSTIQEGPVQSNTVFCSPGQCRLGKSSFLSAVVLDVWFIYLTAGL